MYDGNEEDKDMNPVLPTQRKELHINVAKLRARAQVVKTHKSGLVLLDRKNPVHQDLFEDDNDNER